MVWARRSRYGLSLIAICVVAAFQFFLGLPTQKENGAEMGSKKGLIANVSQPKIPRYCTRNPSHCHLSTSVRLFLKQRVPFEPPVDQNNEISIFVDGDLKRWFGEQAWYQSAALEHCPVKQCKLVSTSNLADVVLLHHLAPKALHNNVSYALLNLEAYSLYKFPIEHPTAMLISFRQESDVPINYACHITHSMRFCIGEKGISNSKCENLQDPQTPFFKWCSQRYSGDMYACIFNVVPQIVRTNHPYGATPKELAVVWMSAKCDRHSQYLLNLMNFMKIDSMGTCYRNRDEGKHAALHLKDQLNLWWGGNNVSFRETVSGMDRGGKKLLIGSHYSFFISIENTILDDYVTEKFYEGFLMDSLLVYLGAPNARLYAPADHSFINALDFDGPQQLAEFLTELQHDAARYESYMWWKRTAPATVSDRFREQMKYGLEGLGADSLLCRICARIATNYSSSPT